MRFLSAYGERQSGRAAESYQPSTLVRRSSRVCGPSFGGCMLAAMLTRNTCSRKTKFMVRAGEHIGVYSSALKQSYIYWCVCSHSGMLSKAHEIFIDNKPQHNLLVYLYLGRGINNHKIF